MQRIKNKIIDYIISCLFDLKADSVTEEQKKQVLDNWFIYSYKNQAIKYYCEARINKLGKAITASVQSRDQYLYDLGSIKEVKRLHSIVQTEGARAMKRQDETKNTDE